MDIATLNKGIELKEKIDRENKIIKEIEKLHKLHKNKTLSSSDIDYLIERVYEGSQYIIKDLSKKLKEL